MTVLDIPLVASTEQRVSVNAMRWPHCLDPLHKGGHGAPRRNGYPHEVPEDRHPSARLPARNLGGGCMDDAAFGKEARESSPAFSE